ncbi:hypothetical protein K7W42_07940 [Deinococcus sp. HMF7604]|uniref:hypothetical protein n=1 Tax=Deinococcus betulae TaxID=2873312 RepID=UPI001CCCFF0F|nr:hypothetical protein [Deinococcus betulae]MBZ9750791.1 hypothetical protein [Deinococcus betulae]
MLDLLYTDWYRYESLCSQAFCLTEEPFEWSANGFLLQQQEWPIRAWYFDHSGVQLRDLLAWRRFYVMPV